jgi:hypothetical protein
MIDSALRFIVVSSGALLFLRAQRRTRELDKELREAGEPLPPGPFDNFRAMLLQNAPGLFAAWLENQRQDRKAIARCEARVWRTLALHHRETGAEAEARVCERHAIELEREHGLAGEDGHSDQASRAAQPASA